jgi:hypothetical protein
VHAHRRAERDASSRQLWNRPAQERELPFTKSFPASPATAGLPPPYQRVDVERTSIRKEDRMFRKTALALAAVVALGTAALIPATADAHWSGYGWYGKSYGSPYYWGGYGPRYHYGYGGFYGPRYFYWGKFGWRKPYRYY